MDWLTWMRFLEALSLLGLVLGTVPAMALDRRWREAAKLRRTGPLAGTELEKWRGQVIEVYEQEAQRWRPWHSWCLRGAFAVSVVAQFLKLFI